MAIVVSNVTWVPPVPEGPLMVPLAKLAELLAKSTVFRARCKLALDDPDANAKLLFGAKGYDKRIWVPSPDLDLVDARPAVALYFDKTWQWDVVAGGAQNYLYPRTGVCQLLILDRSTYTDPELALRDISNFVGLLMADLAWGAALEDYLAISRIAQVTQPQLCPVTEEKTIGEPYWIAEYQIAWGG